MMYQLKENTSYKNTSVFLSDIKKKYFSQAIGQK